ncbi:jg8707 [Pararge aegeria aegeria]|uniref:Jg8707 protein n=1 Tax=Pararge aegeria aegeria TaxID=348720 RepID=A0A8S4S1X2_9NEOP|nr:jg8707 [Pararge aegeria aegeria]
MSPGQQLNPMKFVSTIEDNSIIRIQEAGITHAALLSEQWIQNEIRFHTKFGVRILNYDSAEIFRELRQLGESARQEDRVSSGRAAVSRLAAPAPGIVSDGTQSTPAFHEYTSLYV